MGNVNYKPIFTTILFYLKKKYTNDVHTLMQEYGITCINLKDLII